MFVCYFFLIWWHIHKLFRPYEGAMNKLTFKGEGAQIILPSRFKIQMCLFQHRCTSIQEIFVNDTPIKTISDH